MTGLDKVLSKLQTDKEFLVPFSAEEKARFFEMEVKAREYASKFFYLLCNESPEILDPYALPIVCRDELSEIAKAGYASSLSPAAFKHGGTSGKQAVIYINLPRREKSAALHKKLKQYIRHEIIHYFLWVNSLPFEDDTALFWAYCFLYDGGAYKALNESERQKFERFKDWRVAEGSTCSFARAQHEANKICTRQEADT